MSARPVPPSQQLYSQGLLAYKGASYETAVELFTQAIQCELRNPKYYDARASAHDKLGQPQQALLDARDVIKLVPRSHKGYLRASKLLTQAKKYVNAAKLVSQGLEKVTAKDREGIALLQTELTRIAELQRQSEFCPFANLPVEIFVEIVSLAAASPPTSRYTSHAIPRARPPRNNNLITLMRVCRSWSKTIRTSPRLWSTLRLDGVINARTAEKKTILYLSRALGQSVDTPIPKTSGRATIRHETLGGSTTAKGVQRLILTAAQDLPCLTFSAILGQLRDAGVTSTLREVVLSFVDGSLTTLSHEREASITTELLVFLHTYSRTSLSKLSICTGGRCYPAFDLTNIYLAFPNLEAFHIWGSTTSSFVSNLRAPFLLNGSSTRTEHDIDGDGAPSANQPEVATPLAALPRPTQARSLTVTGSVLVADTNCQTASFPHLESLELDLIGGSIVWDLLSTPNLTKFHTVLYGENQIFGLPLPDLASSWARLEDLKLGGAKYLPSRFLDHALSLGLRFEHLTNLDLSFSSLSTNHLALFDSQTRAPSLETVNLASTTTGPTSSTLVLPQLDRVKRLDLSHTLWTNGDTIRSLTTKCPRLESLALRGNASITGTPVMELVRARKPRRVEGVVEGDQGNILSEMKDLRLEGCDRLETAAVSWLKKNTRPGVVKFQFVDSTDRRKGKWDRGL